MASLSESGRGMYYFIDYPEQINDVLAREFHSVEMVAATDIRIKVQFERDIVISKVMANRYEIEGNSVIMYGGDLSVGELRRFQIRLQPPSNKNGTYDVGHVMVNYHPAGEEQTINSGEKIAFHYQADAHKVKNKTNNKVSERSLIFEAHYARSQAAEAVDRGNLQEVQAILDKANKKIAQKAQGNVRLKKEAEEIFSYSKAIQEPMNQRDKACIQKGVKYDSYKLEGC